MPKQTILIIDYDPENIESTMQPLADAGYRVEVANDGQAGIEAFQRLQPDLVLIEPMVPKKHGFEVCQEIKGSEEGRGTPVLITTGFYRGRKHQLEAKQYYGCDEYLERPIDPQTLLGTCRRFLAEAAELADSAEATVRPELIAELDDAIDEPQQVNGGLPALDDLSEDEIMARLDALIIEEPAPEERSTPTEASAEPVEEAEAELEVEVESVLAAMTEEMSAGESAEEPVEEPVEESAEPAEEQEAEEDAVVPLEESAKELAPLTDQAAAEGPRPKSRRWILLAAAAVVLVLIGAAAIVLGPGLTGGKGADEAGPVASAALSGPARQAPVRAPGGQTWTSEPPASFGTAMAFDTEETLSGDAEPSVDAGEVAAEPQRPGPAGSSTEHSGTRTEPVVRPQPAPAPAREMKTPEPRTESETGTSKPPETTPEVTVASRLPEPEPKPEPQAGQEPLSDAALEFNPAMLLGIPAVVEPEPAQDPKPDPKPKPEPMAAPEPVSPEVAAGSLLELNEVDSGPAPLKKLTPAYPPMARKLRLSGIVRLRLLVNEHGDVDEVEVLASDGRGLLEKSAVKTARGWTYSPATKDGVPVKVWIVEQVDFRR